jgi:putative transcriptional regulator
MRYGLVKCLPLLLALLATATAAQPPASGRLLVATAAMDDPTFTGAVVLLIEHGEQGSFGVMINRPTWIRPLEVFPQAAELAAYDGTLFRGGPVLPGTLLMLVRSAELAARGAQPLFGDVFATTELELIGELEELTHDPRALRLFAGHAAWEPGGLESEVAEGIWQVAPARPDLVFSPDPSGLWRTLSRSDNGLIARRDQPAISPQSTRIQPLAERTL